MMLFSDLLLYITFIRQFISEFVSESLPVYLVNTKGEHREYTFGQLLPLAFGLNAGQKYLQNA